MIGSLETIPRIMHSYDTHLQSWQSLAEMQPKNALLGNSHILWKILAI